ncbi:Uncharacterized protein Rs2_04781 [Raphanus sativus]|nr:Uncharacterized protein Rs2_04781 [Raphanus sativus]
MEIEKAKNCLDLNVRAQADVGDHIVPSVDNQVLVAPEIINGIPTNAINGFGATSDNAVSPVFVLRNTNSPAMYGGLRAAYNPHDDNRYWEMSAGYWESLMASNYAMQVGRIYGVPGSENVGYPPTDLNIGR